jgi:predicted ATPase
MVDSNRSQVVVVHDISGSGKTCLVDHLRSTEYGVESVKLEGTFAPEVLS